MRVIVKYPGKPIEVREIEPKLETYQEIVGGYIENVYAGEGIDIIVNEEGKLIPLEFNFWYGNDRIVGPAVFVGSGDEDWVGLTDEQVKAIEDVFKPV